MAERFRNEAGSAKHVLERTAATILERHRLSKGFRWVAAAAILTGAWLSPPQASRCNGSSAFRRRRRKMEHGEGSFGTTGA
ncbi:MAG: hypothetical protein OXE86_11645 [Alphaproteobacteria bacterium]|nr:hypothetical protein [Alphaproteobacteria bacterium]